MLRLVPETSNALVRQLDRQLLSDPFIALEALRSSEDAIFQAQLDALNGLLGSAPKLAGERLSQLSDALDLSEDFLDQIHSEPARGREWQLLMACMHAHDHMSRLQHRLLAATSESTQTDRLDDVAKQRLAMLLQAILDIRNAPHWQAAAQASQELALQLADWQRAVREAIMGEIAAGQLDTDLGGERLDADRWLSRVAHHLWRVCHHLQQADDASHRQSPPLQA